MTKQLYKYHEKLGYTFIPNLKARVPWFKGAYLVRTNNIGFRENKDFLIKNPNNTKRIAFFGDSYLAGDGVSNKDRFTDLLGSHWVNQQVEVFNFGLPGTGTDQHYLVFKEFVEKADYEHIVISIFVENITRVNSRYKAFQSISIGEHQIMAKPYFTLENNRLKLHHVPVPVEVKGIDDLGEVEQKYVHGISRRGKLYNRAVSLLGKNTVNRLTQHFKYHHYPEYDSTDNPSWILMKAILTQWIREIKSPVTLLLLPSHYHYLNGDKAIHYQNRFNELIALEGGNKVRIIDPLPRFLEQDKQKREKLRFDRDPHPSKYQHQQITELLKSELTI